MGTGNVHVQDNLSLKLQGQNLLSAITAEPEKLRLALYILININTGCLYY